MKYLKSSIPFLVFGFFLYKASCLILIEGVTGWRLYAAYIASLGSMSIITAGVLGILMQKNRINTIETQSN